MCHAGMSYSVCAASEMIEGKYEYEETARFCLMFDKFFDCLNTRYVGEAKKSRKPDLEPYRSINDKIFEVCYNYNLHVCRIDSTFGSG